MQKRSMLLGVLAAASLLAATPEVRAGVSVGIGIGFPIYPRPYCGPYFYRPYPVYIAPAPVYLPPIFLPSSPTVTASLRPTVPIGFPRN